ncbi:hypothetical protein SAMN06265219_11053 [Gracilimonas mengyeensis]|uniref:Uncharacterized protein n=1 Tax=Gracilimonas mengyeensis TaxID=1302730 RepID=A0A521E1B5_9BACT|nr:hypothetical protein SAMN06265219_11053 [Gracilimonas mengyeensis]
MTKILTKISPKPVIARSLPGQIRYGMFFDEAISLKRHQGFLREIAASVNNFVRIKLSRLLAMTDLEFGTCNLGFN